MNIHDTSLENFLELSHSAELGDLFSHSLFEPLNHLLSRPGKNLRSQLTRFGYRLGRRHAPPAVSPPPGALEQSCALLELVHAGSLIVDDIEDGSDTRRGGPAMHKAYGVPIALNAGNWLYFLTFQRIEELELAEPVRAALVRECHRMLLRAHYGQALDVGVALDSLPQERIHAVTLASIELKSGVLAGFGLKVGAMIAGAPQGLSDKLERFGRKLGTALQMYDDVGNLNCQRDPVKAGEDLRLRRLSYVVAVAAKAFDPATFENLRGLIAQSRHEDARALLNKHKITEAANHEIGEYLRAAVASLKESVQLTAEDAAELAAFHTSLRSSYG